MNPNQFSIFIRLQGLAFLQRSQEVEKALLLLCFQLTEMFDDGVCLAAFALVSLDRLQQIACPSVMKEKDTLPYTPKRSGSELVRTRAALRDTICQALSHVVDQEIREQIHRLIRQGGARFG